MTDAPLAISCHECKNALPAFGERTKLFIRANCALRIYPLGHFRFLTRLMRCHLSQRNDVMTGCLRRGRCFSDCAMCHSTPVSGRGGCVLFLGRSSSSSESFSDFWNIPHDHSLPHSFSWNVSGTLEILRPLFIHLDRHTMFTWISKNNLIKTASARPGFSRLPKKCSTTGCPKVTVISNHPINFE